MLTTAKAKVPALTKMHIARYHLIEKSSFLGYLALSLKLVEVEPGALTHLGCKAATDGVRLYFEPSLVENTEGYGGYSQNEFLQFIIAHESWHLGLGHMIPSRIGKRDLRIWNYATDAVINRGLKTMFKKRPPANVFYDPQYDGLIEEQVYEKLLSQTEGLPVIGIDLILGRNGQDGVSEEEGAWSDADRLRRIDPEKFFQEVVARANVFAKLYGDDPREIFGQVIDEVIHPPLPYRTLIRRFIGSLRGRNRLDWCRPNKRLTFYWPGKHKGDPRPEILIAIDASGSIHNKYYGMFLYEQRFLDPLIRADYLVFDTEEQMRTQKVGDLKRRVCEGGTSFKPIWDAIEPRHKAVIIFTDGYASYKHHKSPVPVFWAMTPDHERPAFGWVGVIRE